MGGNDCGAYWCLPLTPLRRVTPTMMRVLHILERISLLPDCCQCITQQSQGILQRERWRAESEESRISVLPNVVKSRHFGIPLKMFTSSSSPSRCSKTFCDFAVTKYFSTCLVLFLWLQCLHLVANMSLFLE